MRPLVLDAAARTRTSRARAPWLRSGLVLGLLCSLAVHTASISSVAVLHERALRAARVPPSRTDFDVVASPPGTLSPAPEPSASAVPAPAPTQSAPSAAPPEPSAAEPSSAPPPSRAIARNLEHEARPELASAELTPPANRARPAVSRGPLHEVAAANAVAPAVHGDPSGVSAQRARLPAAVRCRDAVAGVWRGHSFNGRRYNWHVFTLRIERETDALRGAITVRTWDGGPSQQRPPARCEGDLDYSVRMEAAGEIRGEEISFGARGAARVTSARCPTPNFSYDPDHFSGSIDSTRQEFESVNNDGGTSVNDPVLFRRVACLPGDELTPDAT